MAKLLNTTFLVTQSSPATPSVGFGTLYASGSSLYYKNSNGVNYNLILVGSGSVSVFVSSGTWSKPSNIKYIKVVCVGAGGGGGSGRRSTAGTAACGGGGGAGGDIAVAYFSSSSLTTTAYTVNVGSGGPGAAGRTGATGNDGIAGTSGTNSSFVSGSTNLVVATGGTPGNGGRPAVGSGRDTSNTIVNIVGGTNNALTTATVPNPNPPFYTVGQNGSQSGLNVPTNASEGFNGPRSLAGGGGGGGVTTTGVSGSGGSGSAVYNFNNLIQSGSPGSPSGTINGDNGVPIFDIAQLLYYSGSILTTGVRVGTGGHGGAGGATSGNGGSGSLGAGGGGGGGGLTTGVTGAGGPGGNGFVLIFEYY